MWKKILGLQFDIIDPSETICADFSQGIILMFGINAGKQCVAMSLTAMIFNQIKAEMNWVSSDLNTILLHGNNLYSCISNSVRKDMFSLRCFRNCFN